MRIRKINGDQHSAEFDQLRRTVNNILRMIEGASVSLGDTATAEAILQAWADGVRDGIDSNPDNETNVTGTNASLVGLKPTNGGGLPRHPMQNRALSDDDQFDL